ncbi:bifunctional hydroxymethylpyrimidine kinase/phosphomethylpyrimidine kinase [Bacillus sp. HMF5848]|uniref:bifunctional hydroxymethylpyrimidine kinase/phosphomethylpyrimidine kinase n=1 Tax=Bacillus sp. HMF5848 TaxID=2495421 RepID=UPI000F7AB8A5|nr:bifunctional hydroxymethylpyrimidine kinase/phosphomethylpyrimidine kinase [Bacillus sp. HMF5848]RSK26405.1 bifunctional hydroxymethylpyrimidine kinase/phosphomethylpyrimidine kinase [Bacillus sp. HMF5848]
MKIAKALTIAGSDSGGGAGIQADLKTFQELNVFGMSAITAVTAQNTLGVDGVHPMTANAVKAQMDAIAHDMGTDALKTGMLFNADIIEAVASSIQQYGWSNVVVDPVMVAKGGAPLLLPEAIDSLKSHLIPLATVITPNIPEAELLSGIEITSEQNKEAVAKYLHNLGATNVLIKGGHDATSNESTDLLFDGEQFIYFSTKRIFTKNTHGTGCTFSAAITAELAKGQKVPDAVKLAKDFIQAAISDDLKIGKGHGPTNHWAYKRGLVHES